MMVMVINPGVKAHPCKQVKSFEHELMKSNSALDVQPSRTPDTDPSVITPDSIITSRKPAS